MSRNYICQRHDYALNLLHKIRNEISKNLKYNRDNAEELADVLDNIDSDLYDVVDEIESAKEMGERMEHRLCEYKDAIEGLGFSRNYVEE